MFGRGRLDEVVSQNVGAPPDAVVKAIFKAVAEHAAGEEAFDDETVVVIRVKGPAGKRK